MKNIFFIIVFAVFLCVSCTKKEIKISRANHSVITELTDVSPAYLTRLPDGSLQFNKNNLIGNTHWIITAQRDLLMKDVAPYLKELADKKFNKEGMHPDTKQLFFVYSDTLHRQNAFVEMPFKEILLSKSASINSLYKSIYLKDIQSINEFKNELKKASLIKKDLQYLDLGLSEDMDVETFVNLLIELDTYDLPDETEYRLWVYKVEQ